MSRKYSLIYYFISVFLLIVNQLKKIASDFNEVVLVLY